MIDTIEMECQFLKEDFKVVVKAINTLAKDVNRSVLKKDIKCSSDKVKIYKTKALVKFGFTQIKILKYYNSFESNLYHIELIYKPAQIIYPDNLYALSGEKDYETACLGFNNFIDRINALLTGDFKLPYINNWKVTRVDYAFQFTTDFPELYIYVFKRANLPLKAFAYDSSLYYRNKSTTVNFYDKTKQLVEKGLLSLEALNSKHKIRIEVQCGKKYLSKVKSKKMQTKGVVTLKNVWKMKFAYNILLEKLIQLFGNGDFCSMKVAKEIIESKFKGKAQKLVNLLKLSEKYTLETIFDFYDTLYNTKPGYAKKQLRRELSALNINTILLPSSSSVNVLIHPLVKLKEEYKQS